MQRHKKKLPAIQRFQAKHMTEVGENEAQRGEMADAASEWKMCCFLVSDVVSGLACVVGQFDLHGGTFVRAC